MIRSPGIRQSSKYSSVVGEPLMPNFFSLGPTVKPSSSLWTMNAEIPLAPLSGSVTAITVYQVDLPPLVIQDLAPLRIQSSPSVFARVRMDAASLPASRSLKAYDAIAPSEASDGNTCFFSSSEPRRIRPMVPSLFTAGINDAEASTRATSPITRHAATESAPWPPYSSGTWTALKPDAFSAVSASSGKRGFSSTSAAYGAISFSANARIAARNSSCSSGRLNRSNDGFPAIPASLFVPDSAVLLAGNFTLTLFQRRILGQHRLRQLLLESHNPVAQRRIRHRQNAHREQTRIAGPTDRHRGHRHPGRHLNDRQQRVQPVELGQWNRHADHGKRRGRGHHAG